MHNLLKNENVKSRVEIAISLTDFVDYVLRTGSPRLTLVKTLKNRVGYHPTLDYWKVLREGLEEFHSAEKSLEELDAILSKLGIESKINNYKELISKYRVFIGTKKIKWFTPPHNQWQNDNLMIRLNPELGLEIGKTKYVIKLYFKDKTLKKNQADLLLSLMNTRIASQNGDYKLAILDIRAHKLHTADKVDTDKLMPLLIGEARGFQSIWESI